MPRPWRMRFAGAKYHITVRGNGRQTIFLDEADYERFLAQLDAARAEDQVVVYAYVLMPNHYHLLIETPLGNVQRFMQRLNTAYSMYFRYKHRRPGHCLQGRYGAKLVSGDEYLLRLTRYLHLNPVKTKALEPAPMAVRMKALEAYRWSSYRGYAGVGKPEERIAYRWLALMGRRTERGNRAAYRRYAEAMVRKPEPDEGLKEWLDAHRYAVGDQRFRDEIDERLYAARMSQVQTGDIQWPERTGVEIERVLKAVAEDEGIEVERLCRHGRTAGKGKVLAVELCCRLTGRSQREVARRLGYGSEGAVSKQRGLWRRLSGEDPRLARRLQRLERLFANSSFQV